MSCPHFEDCKNKIYIEHLEKKVDCLQDSYDDLCKIVISLGNDVARNEEKLKSIFDSLEKIDSAVKNINYKLDTKNVSKLDKNFQVFLGVFLAVVTVFGSVVSGILLLLISRGGI